MDPVSECGGPVVSGFADDEDGDGGDRDPALPRGRFEKSESEDSGIELPPSSPFGSESSYTPEEPESLEVSTPEEPESLEISTPEEPESLEISIPEEPESLEISIPEEPESLESSTPEEPESLESSAPVKQWSMKEPFPEGTDSLEVHIPEKPERSHGPTPNETSRLEVSAPNEWERHRPGLPHKLEQAVLRSRRQRASSRGTPLYPGSLKGQCRVKPPARWSRSPPRPLQEEEEKDPLPLPGDGLRYLDSLCHMLEQIAELQQRNQRLQCEKREAEERLCNREGRVLFMDACVCGSSRPRGSSDLEPAGVSLPEVKPWVPPSLRKRSSSHTEVLLSLTRHPEHVLTGAEKRQPQFASVPNLQDEGDRSSRAQNSKGKASQWNKVKLLISRLARKAAWTSEVQGSPCRGTQSSNYRTQTLLGSSSHPPKRLFLPTLVIRPHSQSRAFH
ncbi:uncharacterized protein C8orf58 homolog isoform X2 [Ascaphus truei]